MLYLCGLAVSMSQRHEYKFRKFKFKVEINFVAYIIGRKLEIQLTPSKQTGNLNNTKTVLFAEKLKVKA